MKVVGFLQNAWSPFYAGKEWPRESWLKALWKSRSGQRLSLLVETAGPAVDWWWDNTTPEVGDNPDSVCEPNKHHIQKVLRKQQPDLVVTFGKQAWFALYPFHFGSSMLQKSPKFKLMGLPHPAYRVVTNKLFKHAGKLITEGFRGTAYLAQERGYIACAVDRVQKKVKGR